MKSTVRHSVRNLISGFIIAFGVMMIGCGGGGGGNGSITYSGATGKAVISESNAALLVLGAYLGGPVTEVTTNFRTTAMSRDEEISIVHVDESSFFLNMMNELENLFIDEGALSQPREIVTDSETFIGNCGGSATITADIDDISGNFTGTYVYNNYCENGETVSGTINLSGTFDFSTNDIANMNMSFSQLTVTSSNGSATMSGTATVNYNSSTDLLTLDYLIRDNSSDKVYKVENYTVSILEGLDWIEITHSSGRYYHPDYGYVDISSIVPFTHNTGSNGPSSGELIITGEDQAKVSLVALTADTFEVTADINGDGIFEWTDDTRYWSTGETAP